MATDRDNYQWRPNDNSVTTQTRYDLEAEHWTRAFKSAQIGANTPSFGTSVTVIGTLMKFVFYIVFLVVILIIDFIMWIRVKIKK